MHEQFKMAHDVIDVVDRTNKKICVNLMQYSLEQPESSYAHVRLFAKKNEDQRFQQIFYVNYKLEEFIYLLDVMISVYDIVFTNKLISNVL